MREQRIGSSVQWLDVVDSTNKYAAELLEADKAPHGTVIVARSQTAGKGQRGRVWQSAAGLDLTASFVLAGANVPLARRFALLKAVALAVHDVVADSIGGGSAQVRIKWPNDVLVGNRKVAGILIENEVVGERLRASVVGVGINVNGRPVDVGGPAVGLAELIGAPVEVAQVLHNLCSSLERWWKAFCALDPELDDAYARLLWSRGMPVAFKLDGKPFMARPLDVDADGRLIIEGRDGQVFVLGTDRLRFAPR